MVPQVQVLAGPAVEVQQIRERLVITADRRRVGKQYRPAVGVVLCEFAPLVAARLQHLQHRLAGIVGIDDVRVVVGEGFGGLRLPVIVIIGEPAGGIRHQERLRTALDDFPGDLAAAIPLEIIIGIQRDDGIGGGQGIGHARIGAESFERAGIERELDQVRAGAIPVVIRPPRDPAPVLPDLRGRGLQVPLAVGRKRVIDLRDIFDGRAGRAGQQHGGHQWRRIRLVEEGVIVTFGDRAGGRHTNALDLLGLEPAFDPFRDGDRVSPAVRMGLEHPRQPDVMRIAAIELPMQVTGNAVLQGLFRLELRRVAPHRLVVLQGLVRIPDHAGRERPLVVRRVVKPQCQVRPLGDLPVHADTQVVIGRQLRRITADLSPLQAVPARAGQIVGVQQRFAGPVPHGIGGQVVVRVAGVRAGPWRFAGLAPFDLGRDAADLGIANRQLHGTNDDVRHGFFPGKRS